MKPSALNVCEGEVVGGGASSLLTKRVFTFYDTCFCEGGQCSFVDLLSCCRSVDAFVKDKSNPKNQLTWVRLVFYQWKSS